MLWIVAIGFLFVLIVRSLSNKDTHQENQTVNIESYDNPTITIESYDKRSDHDFESKECLKTTKKYDDEVLCYQNLHQVNRLEASYRLGHRYLSDSNGNLNTEKAFYFFSKSSEDGNIEAKYILGQMYFNGQGTNRNYDQAFKILQECKALIEFNDLKKDQYEALYYYLAVMYSKGWGTYRNKQKALVNAKIAYDSGDLRALEILEVSEENIKNNYNTSTPFINTKDNLKPIRKQKVDSISSNILDQESTELKSIESLDKEAKEYQLISQCTVAESHYAIGRMYYYGTTAPIDYLKALYHFHRATQHNHAEACFMLGAMYFDGDAVEVNYSEAFKLFSKASLLGDIDADYYLSSMYIKGLGIDCDNKKAFKHAKSAAQKGDADSIALLAMFYITGTGTDRDLVLARALFEKAAKQGHQKSIDTLTDSSNWEI